MLIRIVYGDGRHDMVKPASLDRLIEQKKVWCFRRASGWVTLGRDPVRRYPRRPLQQRSA